MIDQFKALMREHFPEFPLDVCGEWEFTDPTVNAMWMWHQINNSWLPINTAPVEGDFLVYLPDERDGKNILVANYSENVKIIGGYFDFDRKAKSTHWRPLPIPPLTTEGGV